MAGVGGEVNIEYYYCAQNFSREMPAVKSVIMHINT
jgi:hypothetical protein